jgi:glucose/arabinose dehydrogenase
VKEELLVLLGDFMRYFMKHVDRLCASAAISLLLVLLLCSSGCIGQGLQLDKIKLPEGFRIDVYADNVDDARSMALSPNGTLFVGSRSAGKVYVVLDKDGDNRAEEVVAIASGLNLPNGVAFRDGDLYVAEATRILRYDDIESHLNDPPEPVVIKDDLPGDRGHNWKFIRFGPDGMLYVSVGAPCNICDPGDPYAAITRMNPDGTGFEVFARGVRNTVGFDWSPEGELWFTDNGRDWMGEDVPDDELNRAHSGGLHFGYPYCHAGDVPDPEFGRGRNCSEFVPPEAKLGAHVAALGMRFYNGTMFPPEYRNQIFIAEHGSWNRVTPIGYRVVIARIENNSVTDTEVFADGWLQGGLAWGRPVDVQVMPDGALLVSDDRAGAIYRISYQD